MRSTGGDVETQYGQQVRAYALKVLAGWRATREDWEAAQQLRDTSNENARAYAGRFLIELLQNAHDEHPADRIDGTVQFLFDESEGTHGTLYVANGGNPFGLGQVKALCKMSRSSKAIGEGIGHKGIGFRSVLEICDRPEIYSASSAAAGPAVLDGYRFRFAEECDLRVLLEDEDEARLATEEMPPFQVPFPIEQVPAGCAALADEGMVTVIRLPIYDEAAAQNVVARLAELAAAKVPVMLFLRRLGRLVLVHKNGEGTITRTVLERREQPAAQVDGARVSLAEVDLGAQGRFTVARHALAPERLHAVVGKATEGKQLDRAWKDWSAPAVAEVAVPAGADGLRRGQVYTFLPLGEDADAPVRAHFNAPFYTKPDRTTLVPGHPLNTLLMQALAEACLLAAEELRAVGGAPAMARAVDLVSWDPHSKWGVRPLDRAAQRLFGSGFADQPLVPCLAADGAGQVWHRPRRARIWPFGTWTVLTAEAAAGIGHAIANPALGRERLQRLAGTCEAFGLKLETSPATLARLIEQIAATLPLPQPPEEVADRSWEEFYQEVARMLARDGEALRGRRVLLGDDGALRTCNGDGGALQEAFFPPEHGAGGVPADLAVPAKLRKRLFYLHPGLRWTDLPGQRGRREARSFLERFDLVRPFDAEGLVEHIRNALKKSSDKELRLQALKFVFKLQRSTPSTMLRNSISSLGLYVPSAAGGLIPARTAAFGAGWRGTRGDDLALVIAEGGAECKSLGRFEQRLLAAPDTFVPRGDSVEEWRRFLQLLGVTNGLTPFVTKGAQTQAMGRDLYPASLVRMANLPAAVAAQWQPHIGSSSVTWDHPQTWYEATGVYRLPGQEIAGRLSEPGRLAYARLVLHGLSHWADPLFSTTWRRSHGGRDPHLFLTPMAAFVRGQPWLPVRGKSGTVFVRPKDAWHWPDEFEDEPPFAPTVLPRIRTLLSAGRTLARLKEAGLSTWGGQEDSAQLIAALGRLVHTGQVREIDRPALQRTSERAWSMLAERSETNARTSDDALRGARLVVERGEVISTVEVSELHAGKEHVYVAGEREGITVRLIRESGHPLLVVPGTAEAARRILHRLAPDSARLVSEARLAVRLDGAADLEDPSTLQSLGSILTDDLPWLPLAVAALIDHAQGVRPAEADLVEVARTVRHTRIHRYTSLELSLDGHPVRLPEQHGGVLPLPALSSFLILAPASDTDLTWPRIIELVRAIAHASGRPELAFPLRSVVFDLQAQHADVARPTDHQLAHALNVSARDLDETTLRLNTSVSAVLSPLPPVLVHILGLDRTNQLLEPLPTDIRELHERLATVAHELPMSPEELVTAARRARDLDELRQAIGLDFAAFNQTLEKLTDHQPISRAEAHEEAVRAHVDHHREQLVDRLRWAGLARFEAHRPDSAWAAVRALAWLTAPKEWALTVEAADLEAIRAHVEDSLTEKVGAPVPTTGPHLLPLDTVRSRNNALVRRTAPRLTALIKAAGHPLPSALAGTDPASGILETLDAAGALDFRELDESEIAQWLTAAHQWPAVMPATTDLSAHGLTTADLDRARTVQERAAQERTRRRQIITLAGTEHDVESGDYTALVSSLESLGHLGPAFSRGPLQFSEPYAPAATRTRAGSRVAARGDTALSSAQRDAIGFIGEWFGYQWLLNHHRSTNSSSWVSTNRRHVYPGDTGDDALGFDFRVGSGTAPLMYEVKATQGPGGLIELGESEVRTAQAAASSDRWRILVITSVLDSERRAVYLLPNPFSAKGRDRYRRDGGALRFSYRL